MMKIERKIEQYADIIDLPRPEPRCCPRMPLEKRAAQFAPFAALTGYEEVVEKTARQHEDSIERG
jgi:hypothetical protein